MFEQARTETLPRFWGRMLPRCGARRYGEKFLTLTLKHSGNVKRDIRVLAGAWRKFLRLVNRHFERTLGDVLELVWVRVCEVTPGDDGLGHAHVHVWCLWPFIPHDVLRVFWGTVLQAEGYTCETRPLSDVLSEVDEEWRRRQLEAWLVIRRGRSIQPLDPVPWPVIDIRACKGSAGKELLKYLVKDAEYGADGELHPMDAKLFAGIYEGFEATRSVQSSRRFWRRGARTSPHACCSKCGGKTMSATTKRKTPAQPNGAGNA
jgi:hypothetical protein